MSLPSWNVPDRDHLTDPGRIPLRPLAFGEIIAAGMALFRRHAGRLLPVGLVFAVLSAGAAPAVAVLRGQLDDSATFRVPSSEEITEMVTRASAGRWEILLHSTLMTLLFGSLLAICLTVVAMVVLSGRAAAYLGHDAVTITARPELITSRLRGRWLRLLAAGLALALATAVGLFILVIPAVLALGFWALVGPVVTMEGAPAGQALGRSGRLMRGVRLQILAILLGGWLVNQVLAYGLAHIVALVFSNVDTVGAYLLSFAVTGLCQIVMVPLTACLLAVCYFDIRIRRENLGTALRASA